MSDRQTCVNCKKRSPETQTNYTLIGARHGWRLRRTRTSNGEILVEWRCPECWQEFKAAGGEAVPSSKPAPTEPRKSRRSSSPPAGRSRGR